MIRSIAIMLALSLSASCFVANSDDLQTIYPVRHAEKIVHCTKDPALTLCGKERAQALADMFRSIDLNRIYSSDTTATLAGLLIKDESHGSFDEKIYDRIYQVVLSDRAGRNHLLHQNFRCSSVLTLPN